MNQAPTKPVAFTRTQIKARLIAAFKAAIDAAAAANPGQDIGGTCNHDQPYIHVRNFPAKIMQDAIIQVFGRPTIAFSSYGFTAYWVPVPRAYQGTAQSQMAEAAAKAMKVELADLIEAGLARVGMYYAMD